MAPTYKQVTVCGRGVYPHLCRPLSQSFKLHHYGSYLSLLGGWSLQAGYKIVPPPPCSVSSTPSDTRLLRKAKRQLFLPNIMPVVTMSMTRWLCLRWPRSDMRSGRKRKQIDILLTGVSSAPLPIGDACALYLPSPFSHSGGEFF